LPRQKRIEALCAGENSGRWSKSVGGDVVKRIAELKYETALKAAYNRDDLSAQMIDIITGRHDTVKSTLTKNFVFEYNNSLGKMGNIFYTLMYEHSKDFVSKYDSILPAAQEGMRLLLEQYTNGTI